MHWVYSTNTEGVPQFEAEEDEEAASEATSGEEMLESRRMIPACARSGGAGISIL